MRAKSRLLVITIFILTFGIILLLLNVYELHLVHRRQRDYNEELDNDANVVSENLEHTKTVWISGQNLETGYLNHVFDIFIWLGYSIISDKSEQWDVLWSHDYPFQNSNTQFKALKPHQKINHFPGSGFITNKVSLATAAGSYIPKAFRLPEEKEKFIDYAHQNPLKKWVLKGNDHRGVKVKEASDLNLDVANTFVQEYIDDPFLIDGRRFDIGIYVTLTSINPLRVYIYEGEWLIRFCPEKYYPFDPAVIDKYVIGDDYMPLWQLPSLSDMYDEMAYSRKNALIAYLIRQGLNANKLHQQLKEAIMQVFIDKEDDLITSSSEYPSASNFFEMVRFDFVLDKLLNIYLMEVNMSPNLSSEHFPQNKLLYEQVVYSMLGLVSIATPVQQSSEKDVEEMQVAKSDLTVFATLCISKDCHLNCDGQCKLCRQCLTKEENMHIKNAYLEHLNRRTWRRVFPFTFKSVEDAESWTYATDIKFQQLSSTNQWMILWFYGQCLRDLTWCS